MITKKITKVACVLLVALMTFTNVFAATDAFDELNEIMSNQMYSGTLKMSYDGKLNAPLSFVDAAQSSQMQQSLGSITSMIDIRTLIESLFGTKFDAVMNFNATQDLKKMDIFYDINYKIPVEIGNNFKNTTEMNMKMWLKLDLTDNANPYYDMVMEYPIVNKYIHITSNDMPEDQSKIFGEQMKIFTDEAFTKELNDDLTAILKENSTVAKAGNKYTVKVTDEELKTIIKEYCIKFAQKYQTAVKDTENYNADEDTLSQLFDDINNKYMDKLTNVQLLGNDGMTTVINTSTKQITNLDMNMDINTNIRSIIDAFSTEKSEDEKVPSMLDSITLENGTVDCQSNLHYAYSNYNKKMKIDFPNLTADNTIEYSDMINEQNAAIVGEDFVTFTDEAKPQIVNDEIYLPFKAMMLGCGVDEQEVKYNNGVIVANGNENTVSQINNIKVQIGSSTVVVNGNEYTLKNNVIEKNDTTYVPEELLFRLNGSLLSIVNYTQQNSTTYSIGFDVGEEQ